MLHHTKSNPNFQGKLPKASQLRSAKLSSPPILWKRKKEAMRIFSQVYHSAGFPHGFIGYRQKTGARGLMLLAPNTYFLTE